MTVAGAAPSVAPARIRLVAGTGRFWGRPWVPDLTVIAAYLLGGLYVTAKLWVHPDRMVNYWPDEVLFEWHLAHAARALIQSDNPLYSTSLNAPEGVNIMANTSVLGIGIPLAPVTLLFGAHTTFLVGLLLSFAGTATGWYLLLSRQLLTSRSAAVVGGLVCGFAPGLVSQATGHLHMTAQFLVPAIVWAVFRIGPERAVLGGVVLGLLVTWQAFIGEEVLLLTAMALAVVTAALAREDPQAALRRLRPLATGLGIAALTAGALLAYPLWLQFFGPGHYRGLPVNPADFGLDLKSYAVYSRYSLAGPSDPSSLAPNLVEEASFLGWPLLLLCVVVIVRLWRLPLVRALAAAIGVFALLSLGDEIRLAGAETGVPGPNLLLGELPLFDAVVPARYALVLVPMIGILLALSVDRVSEGVPRARRRHWRWAWSGLLAAALVPLVPLPLTTYEPLRAPTFITSGEWRAYVPEGRTIVPVPPSGDHLLALSGMAWAAAADVAFPVPGGYFIGPSGPDDPTGRWGPGPPRPTATLLDRVAADGVAPTITDVDRANLIDDLRYWRAAIIVLSDEYLIPEALRLTVEALLGPGQHLSGVWVWDVRELVSATAA